MSNGKQRKAGDLRERLARWFSHIEDSIYVGLAFLLAATALTLLVYELLYFWSYLWTGTLSENIISLLDRILLIIIFVEVLYTVQVSFREHLLQPQPFLVVGLIAVTRRILVLTAEMSKLAKESDTTFYNAMIELGLLTVLIVALVLCLRFLQHRHPSAAEKS